MIWNFRTLLQPQSCSGGPHTWIRYHTRSLINAPSLILMSWGYLWLSLRQWKFFRLAASLGGPTQGLEYLRCKQSYQWVAILRHDTKDRISFGKFRRWAEMEKSRGVEGWGREKWWSGKVQTLHSVSVPAGIWHCSNLPVITACLALPTEG